MVMPTSHVCICIVKWKGCGRTTCSPGHVVLGLAVPPDVRSSDQMSCVRTGCLPPPLSISAAFLAMGSWARGLRTRLAGFSNALLKTVTCTCSHVVRLQSSSWSPFNQHVYASIVQCFKSTAHKTIRCSVSGVLSKSGIV